MTQTKFLLPHSWKFPGWVILIVAISNGVLALFFDWSPDMFGMKVPVLYSDEIFGEQKILTWSENNVFDEIISVLLIVGAFMVAFSRERVEDEMIRQLRLESLVWVTYLNYIILVLAILFIYDIGFYYVMVCNMFTILIFFILRFRWAVYQLNKSESYEK